MLLCSLESCVLLDFMNPETITTTEAARLLGVTSQTIRNWIRAGKIITDPTVGGHNRIPVGQPIISAAIENYVPNVDAVLNADVG